MTIRKIIGALIMSGTLMTTPAVSYPGPETIVVCGTGDSQTLLKVLADEFERESSGVNVEVPDSIGTRGGIRATADGDCDLGRTARPVKEDEKIYNLSYSVFAYSPVVFTASPGVRGINNLTSAQIVGMYSGKITSWKDLGGEDRKIYIANREKGDSSRMILERELKGFKEIDPFAGKIIYTTPETARTIAEYEGTIGYIPLSLAMEKKLIIMKVDGISPSVENVQNGRYRFVTPFGLVWKGELSGPAKEFHDFLYSSRAQKIILLNGTIPSGVR